MVGDVEKMVGVGLVWEPLTPSCAKGQSYGSKHSNQRPKQNTQLLKKWFKLLLIWQYTLPFLVKLSASATFFAILSDSPISLAVPVTNATTFAATTVFGIILGEETRVGLALFCTCLIVIGVCISIM